MLNASLPACPPLFPPSLPPLVPFVPPRQCYFNFKIYTLMILCVYKIWEPEMGESVFVFSETG